MKLSETKKKKRKDLKHLLKNADLVLIEEDDAERRIRKYELQMFQECRKLAKKRKIGYIS